MCQRTTTLVLSPIRKWRLKERVLPLLSSRTRMTPHDHPVCAAERNMNQCQHPKSVNPPSFRLLLVFLSEIWSKPWPFMDNCLLSERSNKNDSDHESRPVRGNSSSRLLGVAGVVRTATGL